MNIFINTNHLISQKYFEYSLMKCVENNSFNSEKFKHLYFEDDIFVKKISNTLTQQNIKELLQNFTNSPIKDLVHNIENDIYIKPIYEIYRNEYENNLDKLESIKNNIISSKEEIDSFLKTIYPIFGIDDKFLEDININLCLGGKKDFVSGLSIQPNLIKNTIFINCSLVESNELIIDTIIHEICHLIENHSEISKVAKEVYISEKESIKYKSNTNIRNFVFEVIITSIAGQKSSIFQKGDHKEKEIKTERDLIIELSYKIKPLLKEYIKSGQELDKEFFLKLFKLLPLK